MSFSSFAKVGDGWWIICIHIHRKHIGHCINVKLWCFSCINVKLPSSFWDHRFLWKHQGWTFISGNFGFQRFRPEDTLVGCNKLLPVPKGDDLQLDRQRCLFLSGAPPLWLLAPFGCELIYVRDFLLLFNWSKDFEALDTCRNACPFKFQDAPKGMHILPILDSKLPFLQHHGSNWTAKNYHFFRSFSPFQYPTCIFLPHSFRSSIGYSYSEASLGTFSGDLFGSRSHLSTYQSWVSLGDGDGRFQQQIAPTCRIYWFLWWERVVQMGPSERWRKGEWKIQNCSFSYICVELDGRWGISPKSFGQGCL